MFQNVAKDGSKKSSSQNNEFYCKFCDYYTSRKSNMEKHQKTKKHKANRMKQKMVVCDVCDKVFYSRTTLWRHKKKCEKINNGNEKLLQMKKVFQKEQGKNAKIGQNSPKNAKKKSEKNAIFSQKIEKFEEFIDTENTQISELKSLVKNLIQTQNELQQNMKNYIKNPKIINNNNCNNTMTINMYLNNDCKNAMNLKDFMNQVQISWDDLDYTKTNGYVNGISNIFVKQLQDLKPTERPIHCGDTENLQFFYKDENKWEEDTQNKKMDESIKIITRKQMIHIKEWEEAHPTYTDDPELLDEWHQMILCLMGGKNEDEININKEEIKKKISTTVNIEHLNKKLE